MRPFLNALVILTAVLSVSPKAFADMTAYEPLNSMMEKFLSPGIERIPAVKSQELSAPKPAMKTSEKAASSEMKDTLNHLNAVRYMMRCA